MSEMLGSPPQTLKAILDSIAFALKRKPFKMKLLGKRTNEWKWMEIMKQLERMTGLGVF